MKAEIIDEDKAILHFSDVEDFFCDRRSCNFVVKLLEYAFFGNGKGPFFVYGPSGCGKTHLIKGFLGEYSAAHPQRSVLFTSAEKVLEKFAEASGDSLEELVEKEYCCADVFVIDDLFVLSGKPRRQLAIARIAGQIVDRGGTVIFLSDIEPRFFTALLSYFRERLPACILADMNFPGEDCRKLFVHRFAGKLGLPLSAEEKARLAARFKGIGTLRSMLTASKVAQAY